VEINKISLFFSEGANGEKEKILHCVFVVIPLE